MNRGPASSDRHLGRLLEAASAFLRSKKADSPRLDAELLLARALSCRREDLYLLAPSSLGEAALRRFTSLLNRRGRREPLALIVGEKEFYARPFAVRPGVLIPRPETELLVEQALALARPWPCPDLFEVGVGSGAVIATLALELPQAHLGGSDLSAEALAVAGENLQRHALRNRVSLFHGDLFPDEEGLYDLIVSNPPYVDREALAALPAEVRDFEPRLALDGGEGGVAIIARLLAEAAVRLRDGGALLLEIGAGQWPAVRRMAAVWYGAVEVVRDLAGVERVVVARRPGEGER